MLMRNEMDEEKEEIEKLSVEKDIIEVKRIGLKSKEKVEISLGKRIGVKIEVDVDGRRFLKREKRKRREWDLKGKIIKIL